MSAPVVYKGTLPAAHSRMAGDNLHQPFHYAQAGDPGAVGADLWWFDTTTNILKRRNSTNTGWDSVGGGGGAGAPTTAKYIVQQPDATLTAEQALSALGTGIVKNTTGTGALSIAVGADLPSHTHAEADVTNLTADLAAKQPLDATLTSLAAYNTNGMLAQTAADTFAGRTITGTANQIDVSAGSGVAGNPTLILNTAITSYIGYTMTYGPYFLNDVPGTATTQAKLAMFNTTTAVSLSPSDIRAGRVCTVVSMAMVSDVSRTAGSAKARLRLSGVDTIFNSDGCILDASLPDQVTSIVTSPGTGVAIASGGTRIGVNIVTSAWTPITANIAVWVTVLYTF